MSSRVSEDLSKLKAFIGRTATATDVATAPPIARLAATLGIAPPAAAPGDVLPPGWHGVYFAPVLESRNLRADGQAAGNASLPSFPLRRYRIGLDRAEFPGTIRIGDELARVSTISDISITEQPEGPVVSLIHRNEISGPRGLAVVEERESIYCDYAAPIPMPPPNLPEPLWRKVVEPHPILLFRFSALRFNSHRVHYDRDFAVREEGLPGLIVQAALIAQMLLEMCRAAVPGRGIAAFAPRTRHPVYDTAPFSLCGAPDADERSATMWALDSAGSPAVTGKVTFTGG